MDITPYYAIEGEKPLDNIKHDGGFFGIFRTVACVGDSLSSGEMESLDAEGKKGYHDYFEYSWGQYMARAAGCKVYNFSRGGMKANEYMNGFGESIDAWNPTYAAQAYIIALGVNDLFGAKQPLGTADDICMEDYTKNADTFAGWYGRVIQRYKAIAPKARFFLMTMPRNDDTSAENNALRDGHAALLHDIASRFDFTYVLDLRKYGPVYDEKFRKNFNLGGHLNPAGYMLTAWMTMSYIDYIIRNNPEDFTQVAFINRSGVYNTGAKW